MSKDREQHARAFAAGVSIGVAILLPLFAATSPELEQWALPLMAVATILLLAGVGIAAVGLAEMNVPSIPALLPRRRAHPVHPLHFAHPRRAVPPRRVAHPRHAMHARQGAG